MAAAVQIQQQPDGRHAVLDAYGNVMGMHNSLASANRQVSDYFGGQPAPQAGGIQPLGGATHVPGATWGGSPPQGAVGTTPAPPGAWGQGAAPGALQAAAGQVTPNPMASAYQNAAMHPTAATPYSQYGLGGHPGPPTHADLVAGMQFGQQFSAQHPGLQGNALVQLAQQQYGPPQMKVGAALQQAQAGQKALQAKMMARNG